MKVKKLLLLGILGTLALNIAGCGGITVNVNPDGAQIEFDEDGEKTSSDEDRDEEEGEREFSEDEEESDKNFSRDEDKEARKTDSSLEDEEDMKKEEDTKKHIQTDSATDEKVMEIINDLPTDIDWEDEDDNKKEDTDTGNSSYDENANDAVGAAALGDRVLVDAKTGEEMYIDERKCLGDPLTVEGHTYVDLDKDGELEAIVAMTTGYDGCYEILDYIDGTVYAHHLEYRSISQIFEDGYCMATSGASTWDIYYFSFTTNSYSTHNMAGCLDGEYYLLDETVTEEEYDEFVNGLTINTDLNE